MPCVDTSTTLRYVFSTNEKVNRTFWQMCTRVTVVFMAWAAVPRHVSVAEPSWEGNAAHICEKKVGEQINERVRQLSVLLQGGPELTEN